MPPGSAAPLGEAGGASPALLPCARRGSPVPRSQAPPGRGASAAPGSPRARQGPRGAAALASARATARGVLSTRGRARDGDACNLWLNWR